MILDKRTACRLSVSKSDNKDSSLLIISALRAYTNWPHSYYLCLFTLNCHSNTKYSILPIDNKMTTLNSLCSPGRTVSTYRQILYISLTSCNVYRYLSYIIRLCGLLSGGGWPSKLRTLCSWNRKTQWRIQTSERRRQVKSVTWKILSSELMTIIHGKSNSNDNSRTRRG